MVVLRVDVHKDTHTTVAVDEVGREIGQKTVKARDRGPAALVRWARAAHPGRSDARLWAIEDCRHVPTRLERALLAAGERVPPKLMARALRRRLARVVFNLLHITPSSATGPQPVAA
jgi:hypothetical protein